MKNILLLGLGLLVLNQMRKKRAYGPGLIRKVDPFEDVGVKEGSPEAAEPTMTFGRVDPLTYNLKYRRRNRDQRLSVG